MKIWVSKILLAIEFFTEKTAEGNLYLPSRMGLHTWDRRLVVLVEKLYKHWKLILTLPYFQLWLTLSVLVWVPAAWTKWYETTCHHFVLFHNTTDILYRSRAVMGTSLSLTMERPFWNRCNSFTRRLKWSVLPTIIEFSHVVFLFTAAGRTVQGTRCWGWRRHHHSCRCGWKSLRCCPETLDER
jgi:hypothetical protein